MFRILFLAIVAAMASGTVGYASADDRIEEVEVEREATPCSNGIRLAATEHTVFEIYSITGQKVKSASVDNGSTTIELPKGCYIVRCPQWSKKVVVK